MTERSKQSLSRDFICIEQMVTILGLFLVQGFKSLPLVLQIDLHGELGVELSQLVDVEGLLAEGTVLLLPAPIPDARGVEVVANVAWKHGHHRVSFELAEADSALIVVLKLEGVKQTRVRLDLVRCRLFKRASSASPADNIHKVHEAKDAQNLDVHLNQYEDCCDHTVVELNIEVDSVESRKLQKPTSQCCYQQIVVACDVGPFVLERRHEKSWLLQKKINLEGDVWHKANEQKDHRERDVV